MIEEKDSKITTFEKHINEMETKLTNTIGEKDSKIDDLENKFTEIKIDELKRKVKEQENCSKKKQKNFEMLSLKIKKN